MEIHDYLILGGGMSGVAFARLLQLSGVERFRILEAESVPGGLCRSAEVGGHIFDTGGGHFLCSRYPEVYGFLLRHFPLSELNAFDRVSKVSVEGHRVDYPLESNLWQLPADLSAQYLASIRQSGEARGLPAPQHFEAWVRWKLGDRIAEQYMLPYNRKIWGVDPAEMDVDWLHKIPRLDVAAIERACATRSADRAFVPSHQRFLYPKTGGFQRLFDALLEPVKEQLVLGEAARTVETSGGVLVVNGRWRARRVINTIPWHALADSPVFDDEALAHHRSFFIPNFAPLSARGGSFRETHGRRFQDSVGTLAVSHNPYAYPIPTLGHAAAIRRVLTHVEPLGIHGLGRWGQWQYFNSDVCIHEAMGLARRLGHLGWERAAAPMDPWNR